MYIFALLVVAAAVNGATSQKCALTSSERVRCANGKATEQECEALGCCYDASERIKCAHPKDPCENEWACEEGAVCNGTLGNGQWECICPEGVTECRGAVPDPAQCSAVHPKERVGCGKVNDQPDPQLACERRGCCYDNSIRKVKWCFHPVLPQCDCQ